MARLQTICGALALAACLTWLGGCEDEKKPPTTLPTRYQSLGPRQVPDAFKDTVLHRANLEDAQPFLVSGYGLVVNLRETGDSSNLPTPVREYMIKQLQVHGVGTSRAVVKGFDKISPEEVLRNKSNAVVRVDGFIPPGARKDDTFDVQVSALEQSYTSSLARGDLYSTDLRYMGADPNNPAGPVNTYARAAGAVFVNPAYAMNRRPDDPMSRQSLRFGLVMNGGLVDFDNPLVIRVRDPQMSTSRLIERRINERYQSEADMPGKVFNIIVAAAQDEALIYLYMPKSFKGDWQHFTGVVKHLYLNGDPGFLAEAAKRLVIEAQKPDAPLQNISYAWEGIGQAALSAIRPLYDSPRPELAFAAARAGMFIPDDTGEAHRALQVMAETKDHPFRVNAVQVLAAMAAKKSTAEVRSSLRRLVNSDNNLVRIEAYKALAASKDELIFTRVIREKFVLDLVPSSGPPMIYATRQGLPRIAVFGTHSAIDTPVTFAAMDTRLTITADKSGGPVTIYYRGDVGRGDLSATATVQTSRADVADLIARLGGEGADGEPRFDFSYSDVVAIVQAMNNAGKLHSVDLDGQSVAVLFNLQEAPAMEDAVLTAPQIPDVSRTQDGRHAIDGPEGSAAQIPDTAQPVTRPTTPVQTTGRQQ